MTETVTVATGAPVSGSRPSPIDSRYSYASFAFAFLFGHGAFAVSQGPAPLVNLPMWVPLTLLAMGIVPGVVLALLGGIRARRGASEAYIRREKLAGNAWATGFVALTFLITALTSSVDMPTHVENVLWPVGAVFIVGMINIAEGAARDNALHYYLGSWLALISTAALFLDSPGPYWVLTLAGGSGYVIAAVLESRRLATRGGAGPA
ncbi:ABC transporter permease [Spiractinospora alimapuensis]|uniref:ABC transporter permease n=1 Tax=Spiractinospora alimapuensis TaxID=2820884 RepID=UPI001F2D15AD|nr:ABC transporter permease [Spiractinospora alimapuensis]QVQ52321.1 ABC transporter permease [Spiractinospora alimapuensis]